MVFRIRVSETKSLVMGSGSQIRNPVCCVIFSGPVSVLISKNLKHFFCVRVFPLISAKTLIVSRFVLGRRAKDPKERDDPLPSAEPPPHPAVP